MVNKFEVKIEKTMKIGKIMTATAIFAITYAAGKVLDRVLG